MQGFIPSKKRFPGEAFCICGFYGLPVPGVAPAEGETIGSVGMTGAAVSVGAALIVGCTVAVGAAFCVGTALGALVGVVTFPRTEQVQPANASRAASTGIKKNRFIYAHLLSVLFRYCVRAAVRYTLRDAEKYAILRA